MRQQQEEGLPTGSPPNFGKAASRYDKHASIQKDMADWLAEWAPREETGAALEVAAGTGLFTRCLLPWGGPFLATDGSPCMVEMGKKKLPEVEWRIRNANQPGLPIYDWIFSSSFLQWAEEPIPLLSSWRGLLLPGGRLLCGFFIAGTLAELDEFPELHPPLHWRSEQEWKHCFEQSGFKINRSESASRTYRFSSSLHLFRDLHGVGATSNRQLTYSQMRRLLAKYELLFGEQASVSATWKFFRIETIVKNSPTR